MARGRRKASSALRLNLEIAGIVAFGCAAVLGFSLAAPSQAGDLGRAIAHVLRLLFGGAAPLFPALVALVGGIVFLEIDVPRMIARLGASASAVFLLLDAFLGSGGVARGGTVGGGLWWHLQRLLGVPGAWTLLVVASLALVLSLTGLNLKKLIGRLIVQLGRVRRPRFRMPSLRLLRFPVLPKGHANLREAFAVPPRERAPSPESEPLDDDTEDSARARPAGDALAVIVAPSASSDAPPQDESGEAIVELSAEYEPAQPGGTRHYRLPELSIFDAPPQRRTDDADRAHLLEDTLASFGVGAKVVHIERGPAVTRYELRPDRGVKIARIAALADDLALALAATSVRIEAPIPGKSAVGIEVPNASIAMVAIREILEALPERGQVPPLWMALGKDITGRPVFGDLARMPHLLVAGATGSGKSVCLNCILASLLAHARPDQVQLMLIDPKRVELTVYNGIPHLVKEVITDPRLAAGALVEMTREMDARYERFAKAGVRKIEEYNAKYPDERLPYVVIVIDELADLMMTAPQRVEQTIMRLAQLARATGIHLVVATQRPSVDVITGLIKANIPSRIAFAVSSQVDSRTILDQNGAERLLGRGDMLYLPIDAPKPIRAQGAMITGAEVQRLVEFWAAQGRPENLLAVEPVPIGDDEQQRRDVDPLCYEAAKFIIQTQYASTAQLQSRFSIGHPRAVRIMKQLEEFGVVGPHEGTKPRRIIIGLPELERIASRLGRDGGATPLFGDE